MDRRESVTFFKVRGFSSWRFKTKNSFAKTAELPSFSLLVSKNFTQKKDSKMNHNVAANAATLVNLLATMVKAVNVKCIPLFAQIAELKHKYHSNQHLIVPFIAASATKTIA